MANASRSSKVLPWLKRLWFAVSIVLGLLFLILVALFVWEKLSWATDRDNRLFEATCDHCHTPMNAHRYAKSPDEWQNTIQRMLSRDTEYSKHIDLERRKRVLDVLIRNRSASPRALFFFRCGQCHSRSDIQPYLALDEKTLTALLRQHNKQNGFAIQTWEGELIEQQVQSMRERRRPVKTVSSRNEQYLFQRDCGVCHTLRFMYHGICTPPRDDVQWTVLTTRMQEKVPDFIGKDEIPILANQSKLICDTKKVVP
jgi:hypothetical protein